MIKPQGILGDNLFSRHKPVSSGDLAALEVKLIFVDHDLESNLSEEFLNKRVRMTVANAFDHFNFYAGSIVALTVSILQDQLTLHFVAFEVRAKAGAVI